jgi:hypothetical protein
MQIIVLKHDRQRSSNNRLQSFGSSLCCRLHMESLCCQLHLRYNILYPSKSGADCRNNENNETNNVLINIPHHPDQMPTPSCTIA